MSCWVVPLIAADYLNTSVEDVMRRISDGSIPVRYEDGFTFVDVLPHVNGESATPVMTYVPADGLALMTAASDNPHSPEDNAADDPDILFCWKQARQQVAQRRQRPIAA